MKTILITGGNGFIGRKIAKMCVEKGCTVVAGSRYPENITIATDNSIRYIKFDLENGVDDLQILGGKIDAICHTAAYIPEDFDNPALAEYCNKINAFGTLKLLGFAKDSKVDHFIYYTSGNSYKYNENAVNENAQLYPSQKATYYLGSKLLGELYVDHYRQKEHFNTTIFRLSSVYGNGMKKNEFIFNAIMKVFNSEEIIIYNNDIYKTDFVYVDDIVQATILSLEKRSNGVFNMGSGVSYSLGQVGKILTNLMKKPDELIKILPASDINKINRGFSSLNMEKTKSEIGITPTSIEVGLRKMIKEMGI